MTAFLDESIQERKMRSDDRILIVTPIEGFKGDKGFIGNSLEDKTNNLHAICNVRDRLWTLKYDHGILPLPFKQKFTSFGKLYDFVERYLNKRGLRLEGVKNCFN